ncbi:MAG: hypothetical protein Tsb009_05660 [Planctomycetaceae bacterium]
MTSQNLAWRKNTGWFSLMLSVSRIALCLGFIVTLIAVSPAIAGTEDDDYRNAHALYKKGRWKLAADAFGKYVKDHGPKKPAKLPFARLYWGISLENVEQYSKAREVLRKFIVDYPQNANVNDALYRVAECSFFLNDLKTAEADFKKFIQAAPKHDFLEFALPYLGDVQFRLKKVNEAAANFQKSLKLHKSGRMAGVAQLGLARCMKALNKHREAEKLLKDLAGQPEAEEARDAQNDLATLYFETGRFREAGKAFDDIEKRFAPKKAQTPKPAWLARSQLDAGFSYFRAADYKTASERFSKAAASPALKTEANYWRGHCLKQLGDYKQASKLFEAEFQRNPRGPLASDILFSWAGCERLSGRHAEARKLYLDFVKRWPEKPNADDSQYYAAEMAFLQKKLDDAQADLTKITSKYRQSPLWPSQMILQGRVFYTRGGEKNLQAAAGQFQKVIEQSRQPNTQRMARFYLAQTLRAQNRHKDALATLKPLLDLLKTKDASRARYVNALILAGRSALALKQFQDAVSLMTDYLKAQPHGDYHAVALITRMTANARLNKQDDVRSDLMTLSNTHAQNATFLQALHSIAENAYSEKQWKWSEELFTRLESLSKNSPRHAAVLSGLAWSLFEQKKYKLAAATFGRIVKEYPTEKTLAPQAAYKQAESLAKDNQPGEAATAYEKAFQKYAPAKPAPPGSEQQGKPYYYVYHAGLAAARTWAGLKKIKQADAAYEKLFEKFPKPDGLDRRLDEWALLNYNAGRYSRADEIFRRIVRETPNSDLADNARYSLAESDLNAGKLDAARKEFLALYDDQKSDAVVKEISLYRLIGIGIEQDQWQDVQKWADRFRTRFPKSEYEPFARFSSAEARVRLNDLKSARELLKQLEKLPESSPAVKAEWYPRVYILLAEIAFRVREYDAVTKTVDSLRKRFPKAKLLYQADEILGRSYQKQALFEKSRESFERVLKHPIGKTTETGAKSQFMIAETYLMQDDYKNARDAYFRVDTLFDYPTWEAPALYQAGQCEETLKEWKGAKKTYEDLIERFEKLKSPYALKAKARLKIVEQQMKSAK